MEILDILKNIKAIRTIGTYVQYDPDGEHKDSIYFATDQGKIYLNGNLFGGNPTTPYKIELTGAIEGVVNVDGTNDIIINTTSTDSSISLDDINALFLDGDTEGPGDEEGPNE